MRSGPGRGLEDVRNIALIGGAGLVGAVGTLFALQAMAGTKGDAEPSGNRLELRATYAYTFDTNRSETSASDPKRRTSSVRTTVRSRPIVYVDGVRVGDPDDRLKEIDPDRIDRAEVVKREAARAKSGSEAENGAVRIFLKPAGKSNEDG